MKSNENEMCKAEARNVFKKNYTEHIFEVKEPFRDEHSVVEGAYISNVLKLRLFSIALLY